MKTTHTIKLSSGKEIELTDEEYKELKQELVRVEAIPYPYWPYWPYYPYVQNPRQWPDTWTTTSDTIEGRIND